MTRGEVLRFHDEGYAGPFDLCTRDEMASIRERIDEEIYGPLDEDERHRTTSAHGQSRHLDNRLVYELATHPAIVDRVASILGPDLMIWRSQLFNKAEGGLEVPWHQDMSGGRPIEPAVTLTAWLAVTEAKKDNACLQVIPGSHGKVYPTVVNQGGKVFRYEVESSEIDLSRRVYLELEPGQFFLMAGLLLHHSEVNRSARRRLGLAVRYSVPWVRLKADMMPPGSKVLLVSGTDHLNLNPTAEAPPAGAPPAGAPP